MNNRNRIIFLDEENTKLSPITAALFRQKLEAAGIIDVEVCSRGNVVLFPEPVNQKVERISESCGLDLSEYSAVQLEEKDLTPETLVLAMDVSSKGMVYEKFTNAANIYTLKEFIGSSGDLKLPLGGTLEDYATIIEIISGLLDLLIEKLYPAKEPETVPGSEGAEVS